MPFATPFSSSIQYRPLHALRAEKRQKKMEMVIGVTDGGKAASRMSEVEKFARCELAHACERRSEFFGERVY